MITLMIIPFTLLLFVIFDICILETDKDEQTKGFILACGVFVVEFISLLVVVLSLVLFIEHRSQEVDKEKIELNITTEYEKTIN